jgi:hypothetical protein
MIGGGHTESEGRVQALAALELAVKGQSRDVMILATDVLDAA